MKNGGSCMKILKIENGRGYFSLDGEVWSFIDSIGKDELMHLLNSILKFEAVMDEFKPDLILNQADKIIYKSIYEKLNSLLGNKNKFKDESERMYLDSIKKYGTV